MRLAVENLTVATEILNFAVLIRTFALHRHWLITLSLISFQIELIGIDGVGINFFDDCVLAIPPAVEINFSAAVTAERLK